MADLPDGWDESVTRIAGYCAKVWPGDKSRLSYQDRCESAFLGIVDYLAVNGWPEDSVKPLFNAGNVAISHLNNENSKHIRHWVQWIAPPAPADRDLIGEMVTDRVGVRQLMEALSPAEQEAIRAFARVLLDDGGVGEAAALCGITYHAMAVRLSLARAHARALWVAPGDNPRGPYRAKSKASRHRYNATAQAKVMERRWREQEEVKKDEASRSAGAAR